MMGNPPLDDMTLHQDNARFDRRPVPDPTELTTRQMLREIAALKEIVFTRLDGMDRAIVLFHENMTRVPTETDKQISHLKELHETRFEQVESSVGLNIGVLTERLSGMDKAIVIHSEVSEGIVSDMEVLELSSATKTMVMDKIDSLRGVHDERFASIKEQFKERDVRSETSSKASKVAVDAALQAAKEAVAEQNKSAALAIAKSESATVKQIDQLNLLIQTGNNTMDEKYSDVKERLTRIEGRDMGQSQQKTETSTGTSTMIAAISLLIALVSVVITMFLKR